MTDGAMSSQLIRQSRTGYYLRKGLDFAAHYGILVIWGILSVLPLIWLVSESSKPSTEALTYPIRFVPTSFNLFENFATVFRFVPLHLYFLNSVIVVAAQASIDILLASLTGFGLAKYKFPGHRAVFYFILSTTMISFIVIVVPMYVLIRNLGWVDSYLGLIAPGALTAFGCFFMHTYMQAIPNDYMDAARIDGANEFSIWWRIIMPMCRPAVATLAVFHFLWEWDNLFWPLIVTGKQELRTLPLGLAIMNQQLGWTPDVSMTHMLAACLLVTLPVLAVFLVLQRQFMSAMTMSGLKL